MDKRIETQIDRRIERQLDWDTPRSRDTKTIGQLGKEKESDICEKYKDKELSWKKRRLKHSYRKDTCGREEKERKEKSLRTKN